MIAAVVYRRSWPGWNFVSSGVDALSLSSAELFRQDRPGFAAITIAGRQIVWADRAHNRFRERHSKCPERDAPTADHLEREARRGALRQKVPRQREPK
jgi:hypothetical protein